jgi:plasmid stabilization system protein ParE
VIGYQFHPLAEDELLDAVRYYRNQRKGLGAAFLKEFRSCVQQIRTHPEIGTTLGQGVRRRGVNRFPYNLIYAYDQSVVTILAVMHQKRRPGYWRHRLFD